MITSLKTLFSAKIRPEARLYRSCSELPMANFLVCLDSDGLEALVKPGSPKASPEQLQKAWDVIFVEYIDLMRDPDQMYALALMREIAVLESELNLSASLIVFLSMTYNREAENSLRKMGFKFSLKQGDLKHNTAQLDKVIRQRKSRLLTLSQKRKLLEQHREKEKKAAKSSVGDFDRVLAELSAFQGYRLDPHIMTVTEYAAVSDRFKKHVEASKKSKKWKK